MSYFELNATAQPACKAFNDSRTVAHVWSRAANLRPLLAILLIGALVRIVLWIWFAGISPQIEDAKSYNQLAINLLKNGDYGTGPGQLTSLRPPFYPAVVAGVYSLFGEDNYQAVRLLQALISLITIVVVYYLGCATYSRSVGLWLGGFVCFYPSLLSYNNLLLSECLFTFVLCCFCLLFVHSLQRHSMILLGFSGVVLGVGALTRSVVWLLPLVLSAFLLLAWKKSIFGRLSAVGLFVFAFAVTIAPWTIRNTRLQRTFVTIDVMGGRNFMMGNYKYTPLYRSWDAVSLKGEESWWYEIHQTYPRSQWETQGQLDKLALRQGMKFVRENPGLTLQRNIIKFFDFWGLERELVAGAARGLFGTVSKTGLTMLAMLVFGSYAAALFLGIFGLVMTSPTDRRMYWLLLLVVGFVCGVHSLVFGHSRYHLPLMPIVLLFSAAAVVNYRSIWQQRGQLRFWVALGICSVFLFSWIWHFMAVDLRLFLDALSS